MDLMIQSALSFCPAGLVSMRHDWAGRGRSASTALLKDAMLRMEALII